MPRVVLVNDTSLRHSRHFGARLVCESFREQFARTGLRLVGAYEGGVSAEQLLARRDEFDLVVINGEGTIHHGRGGNLVQLAAKMPAVLVNCVFEANPVRPELKHFLYVAARESSSAAAIRAQGVDCRTVPDVVFAAASVSAFRAQYQHARANIDPAALKPIGLTDNTVRTYLRIGGLRIKMPTLGRRPRDKSPFDYFRFMAAHRQLCVGRFHAAVTALAFGMPFVSWDSNTWKTRAMMADAGVGHLHFATRKEALAAAARPIEMNEASRLWASQAPARVEAMFDEIAAVARDQASNVTEVRSGVRTA